MRALIYTETITGKDKISIHIGHLWNGGLLFNTQTKESNKEIENIARTEICHKKTVQRK